MGYFAIYNTAFGHDALHSIGNFASDNSAFGRNALRDHTTGYENSAFGEGALERDISGRLNSAFGANALMYNTTGAQSSAFGRSALSNNTTGDYNVAVGVDAGRDRTTGSHNIYLAHTGIAGESGAIRIGNDAHTATYIAGISGNTVAAGEPVFVTSSGELGTEGLVTSLIGVGPNSSSTEACSAAMTQDFCALSQVQLVNVVNSGVNSWCIVKESSGQWQVCARSNGTTAVSCSIRCF